MLSTQAPLQSAGFPRASTATSTYRSWASDITSSLLTQYIENASQVSDLSGNGILRYVSVVLYDKTSLGKCSFVQSGGWTGLIETNTKFCGILLQHGAAIMRSFCVLGVGRSSTYARTHCLLLIALNSCATQTIVWKRIDSCYFCLQKKCPRRIKSHRLLLRHSITWITQLYMDQADLRTANI